MQYLNRADYYLQWLAAVLCNQLVCYQIATCSLCLPTLYQSSCALYLVIFFENQEMKTKNEMKKKQKTRNEEC